MQKQFYVTCLSSYSTGVPYGAWIDLADKETMLADIDTMLKASPMEDAEEWRIVDTNGTKLESLEAAELFFQLCTEFDHLDQEMIEALLCNDSAQSDIFYYRKALGLFYNSYDGETEAKDLAYDWVIETYCIDDNSSGIMGFIDLEHVVHNFRIEFNQIEHNGTTYLFYEC